MKTKTKVHINRFGLEFSVDMKFIEKDDLGNLVNQWCVDGYSFAKMTLYKDAQELLPFEQEQQRIAHILSIGINQYLGLL